MSEIIYHISCAYSCDKLGNQETINGFYKRKCEKWGYEFISSECEDQHCRWLETQQKESNRHCGNCMMVKDCIDRSYDKVDPSCHEFLEERER